MLQQKIPWHADREETEEYIEEMALAEFNNYTLGITAKLVPKQMYGEFEAFATEKDLATGKDILIYCYKRRLSGFPEIVSELLKTLSKLKKIDLEQIAKGEDI